MIKFVSTTKFTKKRQGEILQRISVRIILRRTSVRLRMCTGVLDIIHVAINLMIEALCLKETKSYF